MTEKTRAQKMYESIVRAIHSQRGEKHATELRNSRRRVRFFPDQSVSGKRALRGIAAMRA